ncbi:MAG: transposase [Nocardioides sp.]
MFVVVVTADQRGSRDDDDRVPAMLTRLTGLTGLTGLGTAHLLPFERTVGDEIQGVVDDPKALTHVLEGLLRDDHWHVGLGIGPVDLPLPEHAREGRGPAYLLAREAVTAAKGAPWQLRVGGADPYLARQLESAVWLWAAVLGRRTDKGWQVVDLVDSGLSYERTAARLGISQSAVSQRAQAAGLAEGRRARELVAHLVAECLAGNP